MKVIELVREKVTDGWCIFSHGGTRFLCHLQVKGPDEIKERCTDADWVVCPIRTALKGE